MLYKIKPLEAHTTAPHCCETRVPRVNTIILILIYIIYYLHSTLKQFCCNPHWQPRPRQRVKTTIRSVLDKWVDCLPLFYNPGPNVTVDEQLIPFRGRCPFRQSILSKPAKYGTKIWAVCAPDAWIFFSFQKLGQEAPQYAADNGRNIQTF